MPITPKKFVMSLILLGWLGGSFILTSGSEAKGSFATDIVSPIWLNSEPLKLENLRGKVVMVEFWTFGCWNCRNKVKDYIQEHRIPYAVPIDNEFRNWRQYRNRYWPTLYLIDKRGVIQYMRIGEGGYEETEQTIQRLLAEPS